MTAAQVEPLGPPVDENQARTFMRKWFAERDGWVVLTKIPAGARGRLNVESVGIEAGGGAGAAEQITEGLLESMITNERAAWNAYVSCSTHVTDPTLASKYARGGKKTIEKTHGVWLDLDVKPDAFSSADECDTLIRSMGVNPSLVVDSGSGGRHAYWKLDQPLDASRGESLCEAWLARARQISGVHIDAVSTRDRIMRLPGTVRWPKEQGETPHAVDMFYDRGGLTTFDEIWRWSGAAWFEWDARRRAVRETTDQSRQLGNAAIADAMAASGWAQTIGVIEFEKMFNETYTWDDVLVPHGWVSIGWDSEGRRQWARPGQTTVDGRDRAYKSAHTDWPESPDVMSLFSADPKTGLADLKDAHVALTKMTVHCKLAFDGRMDALVAAVLRGA